MFAWWAVACAGSYGREYVLTGGRLPGGAPVELWVRDGRLAGVGPRVRPPDGVPQHALDGRFVVPAFVDSHVHLAYLPEARAMLEGGVVAVVDLAAPLDRLPREEGLRISWSGPMVTSVGGYPVTSWGAGGYGTEVGTAEAARAAVRRNAAAGARVIKVPFEAPQHDDATLRAIVDEAHQRELLVVAHALDDAGAARAAAFGVDGLAHTPIEPLSEATVAAWRGRFVVSTLAAFGATPGAVENLTRLRAAGVKVVYGTDFGNTSTPGIDAAELAALQRAGLDGAAILEAGTSTPALLWGFPGLGKLQVDAAACFLVLDEDPLAAPAALARPAEVFLDGRAL
jgi:imidazolonepropionase-like amidohydrolase